MNKVVLLSDKEQLPKGAADFACMLHEQNPILLSGIFLPQVDYWNSLYYYSYGMGVPVPYFPSATAEVAQSAVQEFKTLCERNGIEYRIREKAYENIKEELRTETRFADLLLFSNEAFYKHLDDVVSDEYTDETVHLAECPVVILPEKYQRPDNIILAYDGSASSVFAMKQFAHLMPALAHLPALLVYVTGDESRQIPELPYLKEWATRHFPDLTIMRLDIDRKKYFGTWISEQKSAMLVAGAQGRSSISELFRRSFVRELMEEHMLPIFIAHR